MNIDINNYNISTLVDGCKQLNIELSEEQIKQFICYYQMLTEKNKVMNLTAITEWEEVVTKHFLDSLLICRVRDLNQEKTEILDMGTGAGFPGIPLKIAIPSLRITLADSLNKRILFLEEVIQELGLKGISAVHARAEELGHKKEYRERYDLVVSRAVANLSSLSEYCLPFVKTGGQFISYKSTNIDMEYKESMRAISLMGGKSKGITTLPLPCTDLERSFVIIDKVAATPNKYPRKPGTPSKDAAGTMTRPPSPHVISVSPDQMVLLTEVAGITVIA